MSVTFWCPDAPRTTETCRWCAEARTNRSPMAALNGEWVQDTDTLTDSDWEKVTCDPWCRGTREESTAPEVNFANVNARAVLQLLKFDTEDLCGATDGSTLRQRILMARNADRSSALREEVNLKGGHAGTAVEVHDGVTTIVRKGCAVFQPANTDEDTLRRLSFLENLAVFAQEHNFEVVWG